MKQSIYIIEHYPKMTQKDFDLIVKLWGGHQSMFNMFYNTDINKNEVN